MPEAVIQERIILHHDNARSQSANITKAAIQKLYWEIIPHPPYSHDLAPTDFPLFRSLSNNLRGISFYDDIPLQN